MIKTTLDYFFLACFIAALSACGGGDEASANTEQSSYIYSVPEDNDDWATSGADTVGFSISGLESMLNRQNLQQRNIHSVLLIKNNKLVFEQYFSGNDSNNRMINYDRDTRHEIFSVTKNITSLLAGISIDEGAISNTNDLLISHFPDYADTINATKKNDITLHHSLTMQTGIAWNGFFATDGNPSSVPFAAAADPLSYLFGLEQQAPAGSTFEYNSGVSSAVGEVISRANNSPLDEYGQTKLLTPLNITDVSWSQHSNGLVYAGIGMSMRPIDMAKIGQLVLNSGQWKGEQVVSEAWIAESTSAHVTLDSRFTASGYGYYWWIRELRVDNSTTTTAIYAAGSGGQYIYILPEYELVAVFTSGNYANGDNTLPHSLMEEDVIPSLRSF